MRLEIWFAAACVSGALTLAAAGCDTPKATPATRSELAPDPAVVRYRYADAPDLEADVPGMIAQLEERVNGPIGSAMDMSELADMYQRRALQDGDLEDYKRAEAMARRSLAAMPERNSASLTLAKLANAQHRFREAIGIVKQQLTIRQSSGAYLILATAHLALGELPAALETCESALKVTPSTSGYLMRALVEQAQGRDPQAAADFARAASVEGAGERQAAARLRTLWGRFLLRRGDLASATLVLDEALRIVPDFPLARAQKAELALRTGKMKEARAMFEQAFASSRQVRYLIDLARAQELDGDKAAADASRTQVEKMVRAELADHGFGHQLDLVEILVDRGTPKDLDEAVRLAREEVERRPSADTRFQLARGLSRAGKRDEAVAQIDAALATGARDARMFELAARLENSQKYAREAASLDPGASGWRSLGM